MNIIILGVRIIEDSDNQGSDNRGCTVNGFSVIMMKNHKNFPFFSGCGKALPALSWTHNGLEI